MSCTLVKRNKTKRETGLFLWRTEYGTYWMKDWCVPALFLLLGRQKFLLERRRNVSMIFVDAIIFLNVKQVSDKCTFHLWMRYNVFNKTIAQRWTSVVVPAMAAGLTCPFASMHPPSVYNWKRTFNVCSATRWEYRKLSSQLWRQIILWDGYCSVMLQP